MTQSELNQLDEDVQNGILSEDEYVERLKSEVSMLHRDLTDEEVSNMFQMQLRIMALDEVLEADNDTRLHVEKTPYEHKPDTAADDAQESSEDKAAEKAQKLSAENSSNSKKDNREMTAADCSADNSDQSSKDKDSQNSQNDRSDSDATSNAKQQNDKNKQKDKSSKSSSNWWWTYQIVPDWNEWLTSDSSKEDEKPLASCSDEKPFQKAVVPEVCYADSSSNDVIDLTEKADGVFSV